MNREEINALVDQKIRAHEIKVGLISGIAGLIIFAAIFASITAVYFLASS
jgi:predicted ATP-grasp superfamily ATP-dependent carboligase